MQTDTLILIVASGAALVAAIFAGMSWSRTKDASGSEAAINQKIDSEMRHTREQSQVAVDGLDRRLVTMTNKVDSLERAMADFQAKTSKELGDVRVAQEKGRADMQAGISTTLKGVQDSVSQQLIAIRQDNGKSLEQIRATVDDKLQKTLNGRISQSFKVVQLGAILEEVLSPEQYDTNVVTVPGSSNRVEFAVKIPGKDDEFVYLPIDAKFPGETYGRLEDAKDTGDAASVETAWKELETRLKSEAKDIHEKYVAPPATTSFAILFLPFEGLYAEVVNRTGLVEQIQREWHVNVAGPSTMAALLNAVQMGFQTVAIQKRADEIQKVLSAVKAELPKYRRELEKAQKQLSTASKTIDGLVGTRTRAMERTLKGVTAIGSLSEADELLGIDDDGDEDEAKDE